MTMACLDRTHAGLVILLAMTSGACEVPSATTQNVAGAEPIAATAAPAKPPLVPPEFAIPTLVEGPGFKLVPLGPDLVDIDYRAYMSSIPHLQKTFSRSTSWPTQGITHNDAMLDMQSEQARFLKRESFAYAVLTPDGTRERGSLYVSPSPVAPYDAMVRMWVTQAEYDAGFDAELYRWATGWIAREWPFEAVAYPGRAVDWAVWDAMVAEEKTAAAP